MSEIYGNAGQERARSPRRLMLWVGFAGTVVAVVLLVSRLESLSSLWLPFLVLFAAMWLVLPFRIELASGVGTVAIGVAVAVLAFVAQDVEPVSALLLWLISILLIGVILRRPWLVCVYWLGLSTMSGSAFILVQSAFPDSGWWPVIAAVPSVLAYAVIVIGSEYLHAVIAFAGMPGARRPSLRWFRLCRTLVFIMLLCALAYGAHLSASVSRVDLGAGLEIRSANSLLIIALILLVISQQLRRIRLERKLNGLINAALALPWGSSESILVELENAARATIPAGNTRIDTKPGRPFELSAPINTPGDGTRHIILTRRPDSDGFSALERKSLNALAHIATQALYDRRNTRTLRDQATTDSVTGLLNIRGFFEAFQSLTEPSQHAILFMDLDDFKLVNDKHGHSVGNTVLDIVGRRIRKSVRADDIVARIGGDEFAVLLDADTASAVALRIGRAVEKPLQIEALTIDVRISIGTPAPVDQLTFDEVMKAADDRMYEQKRERKDATGLLAVSAGLVAEVIGAIRGGVVEVAFQPVVDVAGGHIVGFEALARYTRPDNTPLSPPTLIDIARDQEVLDDLTLQITDRALHHMTAFQAITPEVSLLSINIEADQLLRNDFVNAMRARRVQHPAIQMCLELTENSLGRVDHTIIDRVRELAAEGFIIALDDYGQEHAAAGALLTTPLSLVKIDRVFLADESNPKHETILRSILGLLADLNLETIVEGVETLSAHQLLTQLKAGHAQGYFYGRPLAPDQIESRLRDTGTAAILNDAH